MVRFAPEIEYEILHHAIRERLTFETWQAAADQVMAWLVDAETKLAEAHAWIELRATPRWRTATPRRTVAAYRAWRVYHARAGSAKEASHVLGLIAEHLQASALRYVRELQIANEVRADLCAPVQVRTHVTGDTERA